MQRKHLKEVGLFFSRLMVKTKKDMNIVPLFEKMIKNSLYITLVN